MAPRATSQRTTEIHTQSNFDRSSRSRCSAACSANSCEATIATRTCRSGSTVRTSRGGSIRRRLRRRRARMHRVAVAKRFAVWARWRGISTISWRWPFSSTTVSPRRSGRVPIELNRGALFSLPRTCLPVRDQHRPQSPRGAARLHVQAGCRSQGKGRTLDIVH